MNQERVCLFCGEKIRGRIDKKFCSELCRNNHGNRRKSISEPEIQTVNRFLKNNLLVLKNLLQNRDYRRLPLSELLSKGFHTFYFTHQIPAADGGTWNACYNLAYRELEELVEIRPAASVYGMGEKKVYAERIILNEPPQQKI